MIGKFVIPFLALALLSACGSSKKSGSSSSSSKTEMLDENSFKLTAISDDTTYGYTAQNPVKVGGIKNSSGPLNERRFLNALLGPAGQQITYERRGSCCAFKSPNGMMGMGLLDIYEVKYDGLDKPLIIYINMYDRGQMKAPKGFTYRKYEL